MEADGSRPSLDQGPEPDLPAPPKVTCSYFVDQEHSAANDSYTKGANTESTPWKTIGRAASLLSTGETVCIKRGTYKEKLAPSSSGSTDALITFAAYPGHDVILDGAGVTLGSWDGLVALIRKSYVRISGLKIRNAQASSSPGPAGVLIDRSDNIIIERCSTNNTRSSGIGVWNSSFITLDGNDIQQAVNGGTQECITIGESTNFEVKYNHVHNGVGLASGGEGIDAKQDCAYGKIHHNIIDDLPGEVGLYVDAYNGALHDIDVYNNVVSTPIGIAVGAEQGGTVTDVNVFNNVVSKGSGNGIIVTDWMPGVEGSKFNVRIINNTVVGNGAGGFGGGIHVMSAKVQDIVIRNNILSQNRSWQLRVASSALSQVTATHNLIDGFKGYTDEIQGQNAVVGSAGFVSPTGDYHLAAGSPAIDEGTPLDAPSFDCDDVSRPQGAGYDMGAYEYH